MEQERSIIRILNSITTFSLDNFTDRLRLQKIIYLARKMGYDPGVSYDWYLRGPYSPSLTRILFSANEESHFQVLNGALNREEEEVVEQLRNFLGRDVNNPKTLELLASVWYFIKQNRYTRSERDELVQIILSRKPNYTVDEVQSAITRILDYINS